MEIQFGGHELYSSYKPTKIKIEISKPGEIVRIFSEDTTDNSWEDTTGNFWGVGNKIFDLNLLEFDKIRIEAEAMEGAPCVALQLGRVFVKGGISFSPYLEKFEANIPEPLLDGQVLCSDEIERVRFQTFICGLSQDSIFYHDEPLVSTSFRHEGRFN